ncbi:MAG: hypothetical protein SFV15_17885 [Polyangiaceae bacterium]|nr:hypothetical protein [Polyangiaceae bacterium]
MSEAESHSAETTEADQVNSGAIGTILAVGTAAMVGISFALYALVRSEQSAFDDTHGALANLTQVSELKRAQHESLNQPSGWADAQKSAATLPIEDAKQLFLKEVTENPFAASPTPPDAGAAGAGNEPAAAGAAGAPAIDPATSAPIVPTTGSGQAGTTPAPATTSTPTPGATIKAAPVPAPKTTPAVAPQPTAPAAPTAPAPQAPTPPPAPPAPPTPAPDGQQ